MDEVIEVKGTEQVGVARRRAQAAARDAGFDDVDEGRVAIAVTEAASNLIRHGGGGSILLSTAPASSVDGLRMLALDRGPGIPDLDGMMRDGSSSTGTSGTGLGAIARQADRFDVYTRPGGGTAVLAEFHRGRRAGPEEGVAGVSVPARGETACGDGWAVRESPRLRTLMVADGVGHGPAAQDASERATRVLADCPDLGPAALIERIHRALHSTRGAAVAIAELDDQEGVVRFCGVGNISAWLVGPERMHGLVSHHGTLGHEAVRFQEFRYEWSDADALVLASDGLTSHWDLSVYPGLARRHPALLAAVLMRDYRRGRDDATAAVLRRRS
jgi:anti-sigma regulatory factor (Ser/Thr protein kinase)